MTPLWLELTNYRSFRGTHRIDLHPGAAAVVGANGSGKSTVIGAPDFALFGPQSRSVEPYVSEGTDEMQVTIAFDHAGSSFRVRRSWKRGKSALDFERLLDDGSWHPETQGSSADTQDRIEATIGLARSAFRSSGYLAQRQSDSFTGAQPKDRKKILSDALALDAWQADAERVAADRRTVEKKLAEISGKVDGLADRAAAADSLTTEAGDLRVLVDVETLSANEARGSAEAEAARAADLDAGETAWKVASANAAAARATNRAHLEKATAAQVARERLDGERTSLASLTRLDEERSELTATRAALAEKDAARTETLMQRQKLVDSISVYTYDLAEREKVTAHQEAERVRLADARTAIATGTVNHCDRCAQALPDEARTAALESLDAQIAAHEHFQAEHRADTEPVEQLKTEAMFALATITVPDSVEGLADADARLLELARVPVDLATVRERIAGLEQTIAQTDNDEYRETARRLSFELTEAEQALAAIAQPEPGAADHARAAALQAKAAAEAHASRARTVSERLAAVSALLEQAQTALVEHQAAVAERDRLHTELDILVRLEQAFGRDGIPAWIVESQALPHIESEANRILSRLGGAISRVELRTERETKSGALRDALDIVCLTDDGERALETFSGGEQSRAEIALALGLVDVLANRRGADLRYLALDEPSGLDSQGTEALAEILRERAGSVVLLASHDPGLRDQFDQSVLVQRGPRGSEVIA